jgi:hypothetical protein
MLTTPGGGKGHASSPAAFKAPSLVVNPWPCTTLPWCRVQRRDGGTHGACDR